MHMPGDFFQPAHLMVLSVVAAIYLLIVLTPFWIIFRKAGFPPAISLLMIIPLVNIITLYVVAFSEWKTVPPQVNRI